MVTRRHKVFISYHHDFDQVYADKLRDFYGEQQSIIDKSMYEDYSHLTNETILKKIRNNHLKDSTVTVVLVGKHTWGRKWIDWEIYSSLRPYGDRTRNGLVGINLPEHSRKHFRLTDNIRSGYAVKLKWSDIEKKFIDAVHQAWNNRRNEKSIDNTRHIRENNAPLEKKSYPSRKGQSPPQKESQTSGDCPFMLAVIGTPTFNDLGYLRLVRDSLFKTNNIGRRIIQLYYNVRPKFNKFIRRSEFIRVAFVHLIRLMVHLLKKRQYSPLILRSHIP